MTMTATARMHVVPQVTLQDLQAFLDRLAALTPPAVPYLNPARIYDCEEEPPMA
jgi:hypothetical protein